jgi:muramidase (phage lysozyme)
MATFTSRDTGSYGPVTEDPNYLNRSQGYSKSDVVSAGKSGFGEALSNIGSIVSAAAKGFDESITDSLQQDAFAALDPVRQANIDQNREATELPTPASTRLKQLSKNEQRVAQGAMSETDYNIRLQQVVSELNARYPGYREKIDSAVKQITGVTPANQLRAEYLRELNSQSTAAKAKQDDDEKWFKDTQAYTYAEMPGATKEQVIANRAVLEPKIGAYKAREQYISAQKGELELAKAADGQTKSRYRELAVVDANMISERAIAAAVNSQGGLKEMQRKAAEAVNNPKALQELTNNLSVMEAEINATLDTKFRQPLAAGGTRSYTSVLDASTINEIRQTALMPIQTIRQLIGQKETGLASAAANIVKHNADVVQQRLQENYPSLLVQQGITKLAGDTVGGVVAQNSSVLPDAQKAMVDTKVFGNISQKVDPTVPGSGPRSHDKVIEDGQKAKGSPLTGKEQRVIRDNFIALVDAKDPETAANAVRTLYQSPRYFANLPEKEQLSTLIKMANPEFTAKIAKVAAGEPEVGQMYQQWVERAWVATFKQEGSNVQNLVTNPAFAVAFNPETFQMVAKTDPAAMAAAGPVGFPDQAMNFVSRFNQGLMVLKPVLEAQYGKQGAQVKVAELVAAAGFNPAAPKEGDVFSKIGKAIHGMVEAGLEKDGAAMNSIGGSAIPAIKDMLTPDPLLKGSFKTEGGSVIDGTKLGKVIDRTESGGDYNVVLGGRKQPLTDMTVDQVLAWQKQDRAKTGAPSAAAGRSQIIETTLRGLKKELGLKGDEKFDADLQDRMRDQLLERRGLSAFRAGKLSASAFIQGLRNEWEGLQRVSDRELLAAVEEIAG